MPSTLQYYHARVRAGLAMLLFMLEPFANEPVQVPPILTGEYTLEFESLEDAMEEL